MTDQFLGSNFQFHGYETKKKVTNSDYQNYEGIGNVSKIRPRFWNYPVIEHFTFSEWNWAKKSWNWSKFEIFKYCIVYQWYMQMLKDSLNYWNVKVFILLFWYFIKISRSWFAIYLSVILGNNLNEDDMEKHLSWMLPRIRKSKPKVRSGSWLAGWYLPAGALRFVLPYNTSVVDCECGVRRGGWCSRAHVRR